MQGLDNAEKRYDEEQKADLFVELLGDYGKRIDKYLRNSFNNVFKNNPDLAIATIKDCFTGFYARAIFPADEKYDFGCDKKYNPEKKVIEKDLKNFEKAISAFKKRNNNALKDYLSHVFETTDYVNYLRFFRNLSNEDSNNTKLLVYCKNNFKRDLSEERYNEVFQNAIYIRNDHSHKTGETINKYLSNNEKEKSLNTLKEITDIFFKNNEKLGVCYRKGKAIISSKPIPFEVVFNKYPEYSFTPSSLNKFFDKNYDENVNKIYGLTLEEIDEAINPLLKLSQIKEELAYENKKVTLGSVVSEIVKPNKNKLLSLLNYQSEITEEQVNEIINNIPVLIDGDVFAGNGLVGDNVSNQKLINNRILKQLEKNKKYAVVNFSSRIKLNIETNKGETAEIRTRSKRARDVISYFVDRGSIKYGQNLGHVYSKGIYETLKFVQQNNKSRFFIIVNSLDDANLIDDETFNCLVARIVGFGDNKKLVFTKKTLEKIYDIANYINFDDEMVVEQENVISTLAKTPVEETTEVPKEIKKKEVTKTPETPVKKKNASKLPGLGTVKCKPEEDKLLPSTVKIAEGSKLYDKDGNEIMLKNVIGRGGEGTVYEVNENTVAKVYDNKHLTQNRKEKLELLISSSLNIKKVCLPNALLFNEKKEFAGYTMPKIPKDYLTFSKSVLQLGSPSVQKVLNNWNRESLARLCSKLAATFKKVHEENLLIGDINANNILIDIKDNQGSSFVIVDTDSFQVGPYPSPVGTPVFTSPEIYKRENTQNPRYGNFLRTLKDEEYAIASLLFQIIMLGQPPFAGKGVEGEGIEALKNYNFDFRGENSTGADTSDGPYRLIWANTPKKIKAAFEKVFTGKGVVSCNEWSDLFYRYADSIKNGKSDSSLTPYRYPSSDIMQDFTCGLCGREANLPKSRYEYLQKHCDFICCTECGWKKVPVMKKETKIEVCEECGKNFATSKYEVARHRQYPKRIRLICDDCREEVDAVCSKCSKAYKEKVYRVKKYGTRITCPECNKDIRSRMNLN